MHYVLGLLVALPLVFTDKRLEQKQYGQGDFRDAEASEISVSEQDGTSGNFQIDATSLLTGIGSLEETIPGIPGEDFPISILDKCFYLRWNIKQI